MWLWGLEILVVTGVWREAGLRGGNPGQPERTVPTHSGPAHIVGVGDQQAATGGQTDAQPGWASGFLRGGWE